MANRNLLPKAWLEDYRAWLEAQGFQTRPGRGEYQALQVQLPNQPQWHSIFYKETGNPHYTVPSPLILVTTAYVNIRRGYGNHHSTKGFKASPDIRPNASKEGPGHPVPGSTIPRNWPKDRDPATGIGTARDCGPADTQEGAGDPAAQDDSDPPF
jgi:hypothetical protein